MMETNTKLKLCEMIIEDIEHVMAGRSAQTETGAGRLILIETILQRHKYYMEYPEQIPPYVLEKIKDAPTD